MIGPESDGGKEIYWIFGKEVPVGLLFCAG